jgi:multiple sugar transport system ATP-binding protein
MTVFENMAFGLKLRKTPKGEIKKRVAEAARILEIEHLLDRSIKALSGGQRQRVALGRAIVREPKVFLMDEPLSNLDAKLRAQMRTEIIKLHQRLQTTVIYVTHDQTEAMTMGSRIVVMKDGYIQQVDSPQVLYEKPVNMFVAGFIGSPQMNFVDVKVEKQGADIFLRMGRFTIKLPEQKAEKILAGGYVDKTVVMGVRPEAVHDEQMYLEAYPDSQFESKVEVVELLGSESLIYVMLENTNFIARVKPRNNIYVGDTMRFAINPNKVHVFDKETENIVTN